MLRSITLGGFTAWGAVAAFKSVRERRKQRRNFAHCNAPSKPALVSFRPSLEDYEPISEELISKDFHVAQNNHVLYSALLSSDKIRRHEVFRHRKEEEIYCIIEFGPSLTGWPKIVHGGMCYPSTNILSSCLIRPLSLLALIAGVSALLLDNTFGWILFAYAKPMSYTANLSIDYRSPIFSNSTSILRVKAESQEGKKLFMSGTIVEAETGRLQVEASALFINIGPRDGLKQL